MTKSVSNWRKLVSFFKESRRARGTFAAIFESIEKIRDVLAIATSVKLSLPFTTAKPGAAPDRFDKISHPDGLRLLGELDMALEMPEFTVKQGLEPTLNIMLPTLEPTIIFGGYIAFLNMIGKLRKKGEALRIIICDRYPYETERLRLRNDMANHGLISESVGGLPIFFAYGDKENCLFGENDRFLAYSWVTAHLAHQVSQEVNGAPFTFFIQEYEPIFYPNNAHRAAAEEAYTFPHNAIFNSELLSKYFQMNKKGVFQENGNGRHVSFHHSLSKIRTPDASELSKRKNKKLIFYARPEQHAERNLFATGVRAIRKAIKDNIFDADWEFYGIGSLSFDEEVFLSPAKTLSVMPRMSLVEYERSLCDYDIGMALMYAPHPSVPPMEMAAAGMPTVTTTYVNRTSEDMSAICGNLIAVEPRTDELVTALKEAVRRADNYDDRVKQASFKWPRGWDESFDDATIGAIRKLFW